MPSCERTLECAHPPEVIQPSTCAGVYRHGHAPVNPANRRTSRIRPSVSGPISHRASCWHHQPSSIPSSSVGSGASVAGRSGAAMTQ